MAASVLKVQQILRWFEEQSRFHFYASSLLVVYEGSPPPAVPATTTGGAHEPLSPGGDGGGEREVLLEYNNNIEQSLSTMYALHKQGCTRPHHAATPDNGGWRRPATVAQQPNGNCNPRALEKLNQERGEGDGEQRGGGGRGEEEEGSERRKMRGGRAQGQPEGDDVEVRMIDFAHVFPSESPDEGYIYGLKNLLRVLREMLEE